MKNLLRNKKGETLVEGVCAMVLLLIALTVITRAVWLALRLMRAGDSYDAACYSPITAAGTVPVSISVQCGEAYYTEPEYEAVEYSSSSGLVYITVNSD